MIDSLFNKFILREWKIVYFTLFQIDQNKTRDKVVWLKIRGDKQFHLFSLK